MKKILPMILVFIMVFSCVFAFTACDQEETLGKWDIRQFYGTYENVDRGVNFSLGTFGHGVHDYGKTNHLEVGKVVTMEGAFDFDFISQEIADWANGYLNNITTQIVIDEEKICIGELEYSYGATFSYDIDENGELYDEHYLFLSSTDNEKILITATYRYYQKDMQFIFIDIKTVKYFNDVKYTIRMYSEINMVK